jgi:hypothetical protein
LKKRRPGFALALLFVFAFVSREPLKENTALSLPPIADCVSGSHLLAGDKKPDVAFTKDVHIEVIHRRIVYFDHFLCFLLRIRF